MSFHNISLPKFIEVFTKGGPEFSSSCAITSSGREIRRSDIDQARQKYIIQNCFLSMQQFSQFNAFFRAREGKQHSFRFKDHADYKVENQVIEVDLYNEKDIILFKLYQDQVSPYKRSITKPISSTIKLYCTDNNIVIPESINDNKGIIKLKSINIEKIYLIDFEFDVAVRFNSDNFQYEYQSDGSIKLNDLELIEVDE